MTIKEVQSEIISRIKDVNQLGEQEQIKILTREEYMEKWPEQNEDWVEGDYLLVVDNPAIPEKDMVLWGGYSIDFEEGELKMYWLPYPEEPQIGLEAIIAHLRESLGPEN
jgi:hypothetical protein